MIEVDRRSTILNHRDDGKKYVETREVILTRKLARRLAKTYMAGVPKLCKHDHTGSRNDQITVTPSYFASHWKENVGYGARKA